jgi:hypothetical protein
MDVDISIQWALVKKPPRQKRNRSKGEYPDEKSLHESQSILIGRTTAITQPEQLTQRKSKRPIEGLACIAWFCIFWLRAVHPVKDKNLGSIIVII